MAKHGLERGVGGLHIYVMCELPSNVILADEFSEVFDGFSIGSNDLTQLTLGLDRDSALVAHIFDERNEAVKRMVQMAIASAFPTTSDETPSTLQIQFAVHACLPLHSKLLDLESAEKKKEQVVVGQK